MTNARISEEVKHRREDTRTTHEDVIAPGARVSGATYNYRINPRDFPARMM
ncbi:hypothetical protein [Methanoregula sp.]|jgi:hypothetical protein|uniref:hypothetical protein n=1 Tax=Methanoregula sp. TaxID=2052170 RepID=UPI0035616968